jgi:hypothetical protein
MYVCDRMLLKQCSVRLYPQLYVGGLMSHLCYLCLFTYGGVQHILTTWVTWRMSSTRQELPTIREMSSTRQELPTIREMSSTRQELPTIREMSSTRQELPTIREMSSTRQELPTIRETSSTRQELPTIREHLSLPLVFWWCPCCSSFSSFLCRVFF